MLCQYCGIEREEKLYCPKCQRKQIELYKGSTDERFMRFLLVDDVKDTDNVEETENMSSLVTLPNTEPVSAGIPGYKLCRKSVRFLRNACSIIIKKSRKTLSVVRITAPKRIK